MRRFYVGAALAAPLLIALAVWWIAFTGRSTVSAALAKLGKDEAEYREARDELVMIAADPCAPLLDFAADRKKSRRARVQALRILRDLAVQRPLYSFGRPVAAILSEGDRALTVDALKTLASFRSLEGRAAMQRLLSTEGDTETVQCAFHALRAGAGQLGQALSSAMSLRKQPVIDSCLAIAESTGVGRMLLYPMVLDCYDRGRDTACAQNFYRRMGFVRPCWISGVYEERNWEGPFRAYGPETKPFDPADRFDAGSGRRAGWIMWDRATRDPYIDCRDVFGGTVNQWVVYFFCYVNCPSGRKALLLGGCADALILWVNDSLALRHTAPGANHDDFFCSVVALRRGVNTLLAKSVRQEISMPVCVRLTGMDGEAMEDVTFSLKKQ